MGCTRPQAHTPICRRALKDGDDVKGENREAATQDIIAITTWYYTTMSRDNKLRSKLSGKRENRSRSRY